MNRKEKQINISSSAMQTQLEKDNESGDSTMETKMGMRNNFNILGDSFAILNKTQLEWHLWNVIVLYPSNSLILIS